MNTLSDNAGRFCRGVVAYYSDSYTRIMTQPDREREELQLAALQHRFRQLRETVPMLRKLADNEGIQEINDLDDVVPLLFDHTMYKSYPPSMLYEGRFVPLTRWLDKLTSVDLSGFDAAKCRTLDDWLMGMSRETELMVVSSSGTTGLASFIPRSKSDWEKYLQQYRVMLLQEFGDDSPAEQFPLMMHAIYPYFRSGTSHMLMNDLWVKYVCGGEERFHAAYPGRLSPDVLLLTQRMRAAAAKGETIEIGPELKAKRDEFLKLMESRDDHVGSFFEECGKKLRGERVFMQAVPAMLYQMAAAGLERGDKNLFARNSVIAAAGGLKGAVLPDHWEEVVKEYLGIDRLNVLFGMSEMAFFFQRCDQHHYHIMPGIIPFLLDPETSKPLPRTGRVTGRWAHYDLGVDSHWGGFVTGDEVTVTWDEPCPCGRTGPYMDTRIRRYADISKGGDKITCAATQEAYDDAMDFLTNIEIQ
jgi:phenylacetate-coenzyme A ligase PaaK-like adenylate-forming protein